MTLNTLVGALSTIVSPIWIILFVLVLLVAVFLILIRVTTETPLEQLFMLKSPEEPSYDEFSEGGITYKEMDILRLTSIDLYQINTQTELDRQQLDAITTKIQRVIANIVNRSH